MVGAMGYINPVLRKMLTPIRPQLTNGSEMKI